jgi:hypothetical protein
MNTGWSASLALYMSTRITKILEDGLDQQPTERFIPEIQKGKIIKTGGFVGSGKLPLNAEGDFFLGGEYDHLAKFDDGTYGVIDDKTSAVWTPEALSAEKMTTSYSRQLNAYSYCLEKPADQKWLDRYWHCEMEELGNTLSKRAKVPHDAAEPVTVSRIVINSYMVEKGVWGEAGELTLKTHRVFAEVEKDYDDLLVRCQELADLTKLDSPPAGARDCTFCKDFDKNVNYR